ncbi:unnamed protein product [Calicophoron daubneyi]|uniref:Phosphatidylinositol-glycan biosynthesis class X protein n=1 Tax=Calicophoron daubneyi TaxID=300641 RepID=A0AAV2TE28_CALDB
MDSWHCSANKIEVVRSMAASYSKLFLTNMMVCCFSPAVMLHLERTRHRMVYVTLLSILCLAGVCFCSSSDAVPTSRQLGCTITQNGFHVNLHCSLYAPPDSHWDRCILKIHFSPELYVDPYELATSQPDLNFTLSKPKKSHTRSRLGRWFTWFTGSDAGHMDSASFDQLEIDESPVNASEVDVEAPAWLSEPMSLDVYPRDKTEKDSPNTVDVPIHLRYQLPTGADETKTVRTTEVPYPMLKCADGDDYNSWNNIPPFEVDVPVPYTNDLVYVMPVTILLLTVGVVVLLMA